ncbi:hypothetical protein [Spirosoma koreense]
MRTFRSLDATRYLALSLVISCLSITTAPARPGQGKVQTTTAKPSAEVIQPARSSSPVLARNTATKSDSPNTSSGTAVQKPEDKQTIGRCWKRLMTMVREVSHARRTEVKDKAVK